jgi:hypothetical protein
MGHDPSIYRGNAEGCIDGAPMSTALGEAALMGQVETVRSLLDAGAEADVIDYRNETPLLLACLFDQPTSVELLLARGANVNHAASFTTALRQLQPGWKEHAVAIARMLFAAGASPTLAGTCDNRSAIDHWLALLTDRKFPAKGKKPLLELFRLALPVAGARSPEVERAIARLEKQLGVSKPAARGGASRKAGDDPARPGWEKRVRARLGPLTRPKQRAAVEEVCKLLATPPAIANRAWPALVKEVLDLSLSYGDVTEAAYGKRLPLSRMASDEGGALDAYGDDHLYTFDWVLELLGAPDAIAHPKWEELVLAVCKHKKTAIGEMSFGDEQIAALLSQAAAKAHPNHAKLVAAARASFPHAKLP